jgi:hypothetical protein
MNTFIVCLFVVSVVSLVGLIVMASKLWGIDERAAYLAGRCDGDRLAQDKWERLRKAEKKLGCAMIIVGCVFLISTSVLLVLGRS